MMESKRRNRRTIILMWYANHMISTNLAMYMFLLCSSLLYCSARDTIMSNSLISDDSEQSLVSAGKRFELGFFTPDGSSSDGRYVGIWYYGSNPRTVVWIANRDRPLLGSGGVFAIAEDGNLKVLDESGKSYWGTNLERSSATHTTVRLMDSGNLIMSKAEAEDHSEKVLWQSFENPTDTFLPGMKIDGNLVLTSWKSEDDPAAGNFTFQQDQEGADQLIIWKRSMRYWKSGVSDKFIGADEMPSAIFYLLSNFTSSVHNETVPHITASLYSDTRLVLRYSGQIQYLKWDSERIWSLVWGEPRDRCSLFNICGNFGSCNSEYELMCKCLPGFVPSLPENWNSGDFSGGCTRKSALCGKNSESDTFLSLKMMKVGNPDSQFKAASEIECRIECLNNCHCQAFSYEEDAEARRDGVGSAACWIWSEDLNNLQEDYNNGRNLNVRVAVPDIESTARNCETCGTSLIPYPLSTGPKCGDPMYFNFHCNVTSGQLNFISPSGTYQVTSINPETRKFVIETNGATQCEAQNSRGTLLQFNQSSPFHVTNWCYAAPTDSDSGLTLKGGDEVEMGWNPPPEPICSSPTDCKDWPYSTCNATGNGRKRCLCNEKLQWNGILLNCTRERGYHAFGNIRGKMPLRLVIMITLASVIVLTILFYSLFYVCVQRRKLAKKQENRGKLQRSAALRLYDRERQAKEFMDSGQFEEDDGKGIDIPFFDMETILVCTDYFSNYNKLGQGGFGPVYKGKFPGGQEIAVKRLSSCSGQGLEEFKNEVVLIAKLQHRNLVRLLGYCVRGEEKMLLYEYMPNKSLDFFLFDRKSSMLLDWGMRFNIILGIARGLLYLHQDSRLRIIHRDLKTSNILLDEEMNPKISDFGLARIFGGKETAVNTNRVVGTYGYMSPEYALDGLFSFKSDVFSFGVVVIEIISGKRNTGFYQPEQALSLLGYTWKLWKEDMALEMMDETLRETCDTNEFLKCVNVGLLCVQEDPSDRPTMSNVVFMLGSETATLPNPKQPAYVVRRCLSSTASSSSKPETFSHNSLTVTMEAGR